VSKHDMTKHHIRPQSRFDDDDDKDTDNIVRLPKWFHQAYHRLFGNMELHEILEFLVVVNTPDESWTSSMIYSLRDALKQNTDFQRGKLVIFTAYCKRCEKRQLFMTHKHDRSVHVCIKSTCTFTINDRGVEVETPNTQEMPQVSEEDSDAVSEDD